MGQQYAIPDDRQAKMDDVLNWASDASERGYSQYQGMSYEEGVRDALMWATGLSNECPKED